VVGCLRAWLVAHMCERLECQTGRGDTGACRPAEGRGTCARSILQSVVKLCASQLFSCPSLAVVTNSIKKRLTTCHVCDDGPPLLE
jgi:hypothetical protein